MFRVYHTGGTMPTLNELTDMEAQLLAMFGDEEIDRETLEDTLNSLGIADKIDAYAAVADELTDTILAQDRKIKAAQERKKATVKSLERLYGYLAFVMEQRGTTELKTPNSLFKGRRSTVVEIDEQNAVIPDEFVTVKETKSPDKTAIKTFLQNGGTIRGVQLAERLNVKVK